MEFLVWFYLKTKQLSAVPCSHSGSTFNHRIYFFGNQSWILQQQIGQSSDAVVVML